MTNGNATRPMICPDITCHRTMLAQGLDGTIYTCPRCATKIVFPPQVVLDELKRLRGDEARRLAVSFPTLKQAFADWRNHDAYLSNGGYRLKSTKKSAPWSKLARKFYPDNADFNEAARLAANFTDAR